MACEDWQVYSWNSLGGLSMLVFLKSRADRMCKYANQSTCVVAESMLT